MNPLTHHHHHLRRTTPSTPRLTILLLLLRFLYLTHHTTALNSDGVLLLSFKSSILSDPFSTLSDWSYSDQTPCYWRGVTCGYSGSADYARVVSLSLPSSQLVGSISSDLGSLEHLHTLNLSSNSLNGSIPESIFTSTQLQILDLSNNLLSGELPGLGLQNLQILNLSDNAFACELPKNLTQFSNLTVISLRNNYFSGPIWSGVNQTQVMDLSSNLLNGSLPSDFGGKNINYLNISYNRISGTIPTKFATDIPVNATLDFSYNNLTGEIPTDKVLRNQNTTSFSGNIDLCGPPLTTHHFCSIPSNPSSLPKESSTTSPPAIAAIPKDFNPESEQPASGENSRSTGRGKSTGGRTGLKPRTIVVIVAADLVGIMIIAMVFFYVYKLKKKRSESNKPLPPQQKPLRDFNSAAATGFTKSEWSSPTSSSTTAGTDSKRIISTWPCLGNKKRVDEESTTSDEEEETGSELETTEDAAFNSKVTGSSSNGEQQGRGKLVTVDGGRELELETLLKASAYILGASGPTIVYQAVLEDGSALAVRRIGEGVFGGGGVRAVEFEAQVKSVAKIVAGHPNLVSIRGFYLGCDEKLIVYEFVANGSLATARYRNRSGGSSPCQLPWEYRLRIARGVARGLCYLHDKKHVHGNLKPSNILLDVDMEPKISDFGLDRIAPSGQGELSSYKTGWSTRHFGSKRSTASRESFQQDYSNVGPSPSPSPSPSSIGCFSPYQPPESLRSLKANSKWDVYSFGVVLIELLTGKVLGPDDLGPWSAILQAAAAAEENDKVRVLRMADVAIRADLEGKEEALLACLKLGCSCVNAQPQKRPSMKEALQILERVPACGSLPYY